MLSYIQYNFCALSNSSQRKDQRWQKSQSSFDWLSTRLEANEKRKSVFNPKRHVLKSPCFRVFRMTLSRLLFSLVFIQIGSAVEQIPKGRSKHFVDLQQLHQIWDFSFNFITFFAYFGIFSSVCKRLVRKKNKTFWSYQIEISQVRCSIFGGSWEKV